MKKNLIVITICLLMVGCQSTVNEQKVEKVVCTDKTFVSNLELKEFLHPLTKNGILTHSGGNVEDIDLPAPKEFESSRFSVYELENNKNYYVNYSENVDDRGETIDLTISNYSKSTQWYGTGNTTLTLTTNGSNQYILLSTYYNGYQVDSTMDRKDNKPTSCVTYDMETYEYYEDCTEEQENVVLLKQEEMSTLLNYALLEMNIQPSNMGINLYDEVDIEEYIQEIPPVWTGTNPLEEMIIEASKKENYSYLNYNDDIYVYFTDGDKVYNISYYLDQDYGTYYNFSIQITSLSNDNVAFFMALRTPFGIDKGNPYVYFTSHDQKTSCRQELGNHNSFLICQFENSGFGQISTDSDSQDVISTVIEVKELFTDLNVNFEDYFQLKNLYE